MSISFNLPINNEILIKLQENYIKKAKGEGRNRKKRIEKLYYNIKINDINFEGDREFYPRWQEITNFNFEGKKILDIGSNIGLIGIFLIHFKGAESVTFLEHDSASCQIIKKLSESLGIKNKIKVINKDFNKINLERTLGINYDKVIMLSSFKYFDDKPKAMNYFNNFNSILFDGDDPEYEEEYENYFLDFNFKSKKICRIDDNRERMLYHFFK